VLFNPYTNITLDGYVAKLNEIYNAEKRLRFSYGGRQDGVFIEGSLADRVDGVQHLKNPLMVELDEEDESKTYVELFGDGIIRNNGWSSDEEVMEFSSLTGIIEGSEGDQKPPGGWVN